MSEARRSSRFVVLLVIPVSLVAFWAALLEVKGPYWLGLNSDPDYGYLLEAATVANGLPVIYVDHPGTPIEVLGAAVVRPVHWVVGEGDLVADVVGHPERYLVAIQWTLFAIYAAALVLLGSAVRSATGSAVAAMFAQLTPVLSETNATMVACVKPEPLLLALSACAGALVMRALVYERGHLPRRDAALLGAVAGATLATKITAVPLVFLGVVLIDGWPAVAAFAGATGIAAALLTMPAWRELPRFLSYVQAMGTHAGRYGTGDPTLLDPGAYASGLRRLLATEPALVLAVLACVAAVVVARRQEILVMPRIGRALVAVLVALVSSLLIVARHPANAYLAPALGLTGVALVLSWMVLARRVRQAPPRVRVAAITLVALVVLALGAREFAANARVRRELASAAAAQLEARAEVQRRYPEANVITYYGSSDPAYALHFGNLESGHRYTNAIAARYPLSAFYNVWARKFERYPEWRPRVGRDGQATFVLQGAPLEPMRLPPGRDAKIVWANEREAVYELR